MMGLKNAKDTCYDIFIEKKRKDNQNRNLWQTYSKRFEKMIKKKEKMVIK